MLGVLVVGVVLPYVLLQVTAVTAAVRAIKAAVGFLPCVGAQVGLQVVTAADGASTDRTNHWSPTKHPPTVHLGSRPLQRDPTASLARPSHSATHASGQRP